MSNSWFQFKNFRIIQEHSAMKVGVDSVLFGSCIGFRSPGHILDIGAGTGLLSFMAHQRTGAGVTAVEIDENSYKECLQNIEMNNKQGIIRVFYGSFQDFAVQSTDTFDHIISNPPWFQSAYDSPDQIRNLARQSVHLSAVDMIKGVDRLLSENGFFSVIVPYDSDFEYKQEAANKELYCFNRIMIRPTQKKFHHRVILEFSRQNVETKTSEICIRDALTGGYTEEYKRLTKDFYLDKS
jgi:tRNA1Val (adenine37-N6)-methyltransferase